MSLHAKLSPQAQAALDTQKRNATLTSVIIALLICTLLCVILTLVFLKNLSTNTDPLIGINLPQQIDDPIDPPTVSNNVERRPPSAPSAATRPLHVETSTPISIPIAEFPTISLNFGKANGDGNGTEFGDGGLGGPTGFKPLPPGLIKRCSKADRLQRLAKQGGTPECEDAVGMTGLALLAYLGHCETPNSAEFGGTVLDAITYLTTIGIKNNGSLATNFNDKHWPYEHAIATYALAEAYTLCNAQNLTIPNLKEVVQKAGLHIINSQHSTTGAWDYAYDTTGSRGGDSSIVCWHLQALKACKTSGIEFPNIKRTANKALDYLAKCQKEDGGVYYTPAGGSLPTMTGATMLCFQQWGKGSRSTVRKANQIAQNVEFDYNSPSADLYAHYYYVQAMINRGGSDWTKYNQKFRDQLLNNQNQDGSYKTPGGGQKINAIAATYASGPYATHYRTCLNTLMLETYYRFLPTQ